MTSGSPPEMEPPGWYHAEGDPPNTVRYWSGYSWTTAPIAPPSTPQFRQFHQFDQTDLIKPINRLGGRILDHLIVAFVVFAATALLAGDQVVSFNEATSEASATGAPAPSLPSRVILTIGLSAFAWEAAWIGLAGAPPGMRIFGGRVADATKTETWQLATPLQGIARSSGRLLYALSAVAPPLSFVVLFFGILLSAISLIVMWSDDQRQSLMDRFARTRVVYAAAIGAPHL